MEASDDDRSYERQIEQEQLPDVYDDLGEQKTKSFVVPDSKIKLLACERCRLIKSEMQWKTTMGCENCRQVAQMSNDYKSYTSSKIDGVVCIMEHNRSWLRKKLNLGKNIVYGLYAVQLL